MGNMDVLDDSHFGEWRYKNLASEDAIELCKYLADRVEKYFKKRPKITDGWFKEMQALLDRGSPMWEVPEPIAPQYVKWVIDYIFDNTDGGKDRFVWADYIMSATGLRKKWDKICLWIEKQCGEISDQRVKSLCDRLADRVHEYSGVRPKMDASWYEFMKLLLERGCSEWAQPQPIPERKIGRMIDFVFTYTERDRGGFVWADHIRTPADLRDKWEKLRTWANRRIIGDTIYGAESDRGLKQSSPPQTILDRELYR